VSNVSIHTSNLSIGYRREAGAHTGDVVVQRDLTFSLHHGEMVCMLGPNGAGKSTLLRTLAGLQPALAGDCNLLKLSAAERARRVALVLTERTGADNTTVRDIVAMGRYPYIGFMGSLSEEDNRVVDLALQQADITRYATRFFNALSDGEKQRVLIAKALAQTTPVILLDEPTAHLDLPNRITLLQLLSRLAHEQGKTILISTHELSLALSFADRILLLAPDKEMRLASADTLQKQDAFNQAFGMNLTPFLHR